MRAILVVAGLVTASPLAAAQEAENLADAIAGDASCSDAAKADLSANLEDMRESGSVSDERLATALGGIAADEAQCAPVRDAARELAASYPASEGLLEPSSGVAAAAMASTFAEARRRAENMQFEVGPPPRNLTRGNIPDS